MEEKEENFSRFKRSNTLPIEERIANIEVAQARWTKVYGEPNESLVKELEKLRKEK